MKLKIENVIDEEMEKAKKYKALADFGWDFMTHKRLSPMECERNRFFAERHKQIAEWLQEFKNMSRKKNTMKGRTVVPNCPMRHENGNCLPMGGFCTANKDICEALRNAYDMGKTQAHEDRTSKSLQEGTENEHIDTD